MAEHIASEMFSAMVSDVHFLGEVYRPVFSSITRESFEKDKAILPGTKNPAHKSEGYKEGIGELFFKLLDRSFKPRGGTSVRNEAMSNYMGRQDVEDAINGAYQIFKTQLKKDLISKLSKRINRSYAPYKYTLYKVIEKESKGGANSGRWEPVDSYMGNAMYKETIEESKNKFITKFKEEGLDTNFLEKNFDKEYMIKATRQNVLDDLGMNFNPGAEDEIVDDMINRMLIYYFKNPDEFDKVLVRAVLPSKSKIKTKDKPIKPTDLSVDDRKKDDRVYKGDEEELDEDSGTTLGLAWFRPLPEGKDTELNELRGLTRRKKNIDDGVRKYLAGAGSQGIAVPWEFEKMYTIQGKDPTVKWDYESESTETTPVIVMEFKLPDYSESRVFSMPIPGNLSPAVRDKRPGESFTMSYKGYSPDKGILVQFNEMADKKKAQLLDTIQEDGIPEGKLPKLVMVMSDNYLDNMAEISKAGLGEILNDLRGVVTIGGSRVDSPEEMEDVIESYITERNTNPRDTDLISDMIESVDTEESRKEQVKREFGGEVSEVLAKGDEISKKIEEISEIISREFPIHAEFDNINKVGLAKAMMTYSTMKWVIRVMLDDSLLKLGQSGKVPWREFTEQLIKSELFKDPALIKRYMGAADISEFFTAINIVRAKERGFPNDQIMEMVAAYKSGKYRVDPKDYPEIVQYLRGISTSTLSKPLKAIQTEIQKVLLDMYRRGDSIVRKIFRTAPGFEGKIKGVSETIKNKQQEYKQQSQELEDALLDRDFDKADKILKSVKIKAGGDLTNLVKAQYSPGGEGIDDKSQGIIEKLVTRFESYTDALLEDMYQKEVGKVVKTDTKEAATQIYQLILSGEFNKEASIGYSSVIMDRVIRECLSNKA